MGYTDFNRQQALNVLGEPLEHCCDKPITGFFRDGFCHTDAQDQGVHTVCAQMSEEFLAFSKARGNDLSTPRPEFGFPGLQPGDYWCLCAARWAEALAADCAPLVKLSSCHERTLSLVNLADLKAYAL